MSEIEIGGHTYQIGRLDVFKQFFVVRKLAPALPAFASVFNPREDGRDITGPLFAIGFGQLPDADAEFVLNTCLDAVSRRDGAGWAPVKMRGANGSATPSLMYQDLTLRQVFELAKAVMVENLDGFFGEARDLFQLAGISQTSPI